MGADIPDTMNIFGVYDYNVMMTTFTSTKQYIQYLQVCVGFCLILGAILH